MADLVYGKEYKLGNESRTDREDGDHSFHCSCVLYNDAPFQAIVIGVLKSVVRINDTEKVNSRPCDLKILLTSVQILVLGPPKAEILANVFNGQNKALVKFLATDCGRMPRVCSSYARRMLLLTAYV
jgi:hypothetical protein